MSVPPDGFSCEARVSASEGSADAGVVVGRGVSG